MPLTKASAETISPVSMDHHPTDHRSHENRFLSVEIDQEGNIHSETEMNDPGSLERKITPGMIDLQINGFAGVDYNDPALDPEAFEQSLEAMLATGVTSCLPTIISGYDEHLQACFKALERARKSSELARTMVVGYHLEGPFLSPKPGYCGAHQPEVMRPADSVLFEKWQHMAGGNIRLITVAPEIEGALPFIEKVSKQSILVSIGHTTAGFDLIRQAVDVGAVLSTHLGNGTAGELSKHDNPILAQLAEDRLHAGFIADGFHLSKEQLKVYLRAKGLKRSLLVTDGTQFSAVSPEGDRLMPLEREPHRKTEASSPPIHPVTKRPSGSAATLDQCVRNMMEWFDLTLEETVLGASLHPKQLLESVQITQQESQKAQFVTWVRTRGTWWVTEARSGPFVFQHPTTTHP